MEATSIPQLVSMGQEIDTSPEVFGWLSESTHLIDDPSALQEQMDREGYLYLPGALNRAEVLAARHELAERLAAEGYVDTNYPVDEMVAKESINIAFKPELTRNNPPLDKVLYNGPMLTVFRALLGSAVRHYDYTWLRTVAPGRGTPPHMDIVFMGRGTKRLFTAWTPLGDIPLEQGGLLVLERSHKHERLNKGYGSKDVDSYCSNKVGAGYTRMGGGGNITAGGWLSRSPAKLRARLGGRWLTANYQAGDVLLFSMFTVHTSLDNRSNRIRLSSDSRYQLASEAIDERWIGENPVGHGPELKREMIC